jgi:poly(A) polymerase
MAQDSALFVLVALRNGGHTAYFAGGCVRDRLMGLPPKDYDVATSATPEQVLQLFPRSQKVGLAFGVVLVRRQGQQIEVATFRADGDYSDGRRPDSVRFTTAEEDARRRDFTCNGLFFDPLTETLHDFVGGERDIQARILRAIGNPAHRFAEDHLRMLRALRFAARLGFTIEAETRQAIDTLQSNILTISRERIGEEIRMMLEHPARVAAMELLAGFPAMFNGVFGFAVEGDATEHDWPTLSGLPARVDRAIALMAILRDAGVNDCRNQLGDLRTKLVLSNTETEELVWLCDHLPLLEKWEDLSKPQFKRIMASLHWKDLEILYRADPVNAEQLFAFTERVESLLDEGVAPRPFITGNLLISLGAHPGPTFKDWLDQLYDQQLNGDLLNSEDAIAAARKLIATSA